MMDCRFYVGQKVVCIDAGRVPALRDGVLYTVREVLPLPNGCHFERPHELARICVRLEEVRRPVTLIGLEEAYAHTRFRPVTDISGLEALLQTKKTPTPELVE